jgi:hypothetical protein
MLYYEQRTTKGGLLISEAVAVSQAANGFVPWLPEFRVGSISVIRAEYRFLKIPGLCAHCKVQRHSWYVDQGAGGIMETNCHARGGAFFCQIWHAGRVSNRSMFTLSNINFVLYKNLMVTQFIVKQENFQLAAESIFCRNSLQTLRNIS